MLHEQPVKRVVVDPGGERDQVLNLGIAPAVKIDRVSEPDHRAHLRRMGDRFTNNHRRRHHARAGIAHPQIPDRCVVVEPDPVAPPAHRVLRELVLGGVVPHRHHLAHRMAAHLRAHVARGDRAVALAVRHRCTVEGDLAGVHAVRLPDLPRRRSHAVGRLEIFDVQGLHQHGYDQAQPPRRGQLRQRPILRVGLPWHPRLLVLTPVPTVDLLDVLALLVEPRDHLIVDELGNLGFIHHRARLKSWRVIRRPPPSPGVSGINVARSWSANSS